MTSRSKPKGDWLLPNDVLFNWPLNGSAAPKPIETKRQPTSKAKVRKVQKLTFLCEKYDPVWLRKFLKKSGFGYEAKPKRQFNDLSLSPFAPFVSMVRHRPSRRCGMRPRRSNHPKVDKPRPAEVVVTINYYLFFQEIILRLKSHRN